MRKLFSFFCINEFRINMYVNWIGKKKNNWFSRCISFILRKHLKKKYHILLGKNMNLDEDLVLPHPHNIILGNECKIGKHCTIYHDVTVGQNRGKYPLIGNNVIIYTGARIIGDINIGDWAVIGANSVITNDIPAYGIAAGIPGKILKYRGSEDEFNEDRFH